MTLADEARQESYRWSPSGPKPTLWLTVEDVCQITQLPLSTVKKYVHHGILTAYRPGTSQQLRFKASDVDKLFRKVVPSKADFSVPAEDSEDIEPAENGKPAKDIQATPVETVKDVKADESANRAGYLTTTEAAARKSARKVSA
jgi:excisionase family DNA binding protein